MKPIYNKSANFTESFDIAFDTINQLKSAIDGVRGLHWSYGDTHRAYYRFTPSQWETTVTS